MVNGDESSSGSKSSASSRSCTTKSEPSSARSADLGRCGAQGQTRVSVNDFSRQIASVEKALKSRVERAKFDILGKVEMLGLKNDSIKVVDWVCG